MFEIRFQTTKKGPRAYKYSRTATRWFPMPYEEARVAIAIGAAYDVSESYNSGAAYNAPFPKKR